MRPVPRVCDMMNRKPVILDPEMRMGEVARIFLKKKIPSAAVVGEDQRFVGVVSTQGLMLALVDAVHDEVPAGAVSGYLDPDPPRLSEQTPLMVVAEMFVKGGYSNRSLPVLRGDRLVGLVTRLGVIQAVMDYFAGAKDQKSETLYISALKNMDETPPF